MKVLLTGGTGFIGSHTALAMLADGHRVRLLARNPAKAADVYRAHGVEITDVVSGDMRDEAAVSEAVAGCDAVVHCAAEIGVASGSGPGNGTANFDGSRIVFEAARAARCDPIIYTSTITAYLPTADQTVNLRTALAEPLSAYAASKRDVELLVGEYQADGVPITCVILGGVYGPGSPGVDGASAAIIAAMDSLMLAPPGGLGVVDVRDASELMARLLTPGQGPRRIMAGGRFVSWAEWAVLLSEACGRPVPCHPVSAGDLVSLGREFDRKRDAGQDVLPLSEEAAVIMTAGRPADNAEAVAILGRDYRPTLDTFRDTIGFLRQAGRLTS